MNLILASLLLIYSDDLPVTSELLDPNTFADVNYITDVTEIFVRSYSKILTGQKILPLMKKNA